MLKLKIIYTAARAKGYLYITEYRFSRKEICIMNGLNRTVLRHYYNFENKSILYSLCALLTNADIDEIIAESELVDVNNIDKEFREFISSYRK